MRKLILFFIVFLTACNPNLVEETVTPTALAIKIGEHSAEFLQRNNLPPKGHVNKQPAGLNFYNVDWSSRSLGTVLIEHEKYSFQIPHAYGVMGTENTAFVNEGLASFSINASMSSSDADLHDDVRREFIKLLQHLIELGWKPLISYNHPRLSGEQAYRYYQENTYTFSPPINYSPTLDEWMQIDFGYWYLYADDVFLDINFRRGVESKDPNKAAYLFSFGLHAKEIEARAQFEGEDRDRWQELWIDKIKSMKRERYEKEKELIKRGFTIYTEYQEPKIHPLDPIEP